MRNAFTFIELVFVIVVIGILAKFGTNILLTTYKTATASFVNNKILADTELTLSQLSNRLQYRIRSSVVARNGAAGGFSGLASAGGGETVLEWIGYDIDGWLGTAASTDPTWSGFIDVNNAGALGVARNYLESPGTNTGNVNTTIQALSPGAAGTGISNSAIFFTGENSNTLTDYGWDENAELFQSTTAAHRINSLGGGLVTQLADATLPLPLSTFAGTDIYENYKLAWTAYAVSLEDGDGDGVNDDLVLYYDYQPWEGEAYDDANSSSVLLLQNVDTFTFQAIGETIKIQICVSDNDALGAGDGGYAVCQETAIF
ncbi:MAG: protein containing prepilin-type N- cleavage/methylation domain protein [Arcobacter sp.]|nr:MAG: protein containing prepilin-type N- cleavage/methylation domain protein [Arcobacter sp.]